MNTTKKHTLTRKNAGSKAADPAKSKPSFTLKERCKQLIIGDYIELVCEDNFDVLIVEGKPDREALNEAKMTILTEFGELSGGSESEVASMYDKITQARAQIDAIGTALDVLARDFDGSCFDDACRILQTCGISTRTWRRKTVMSDVKRTAAILKSKEVRLKIDIERYNKMASKSEGKKLTEVDIRVEMSVISSHLKYGIADDCNLATYAAHKKNYVASVKAMERAQEKIKNR